MANRKVLINRHTSGSSAPLADSMYLGEIAVAHETGKETLFTKNNAGKMVPFISCGQTIDIIDSKIKAADVSYDVKAKEGETFINVERGANGSAVTFTLSSEDIQSKKAFDAYSAATDATIKENYNTLSGAINNVLDIVTTAITGDDIIKVDPTTSGAGAYKLTHEKALATDGFKKLTTDAYGHVTAATPVTTEDIQALGFKTSAQTGEDLDALSASVVTNKTNIEALSGGTLQLSADTHNKIVSVYNSATSYADSAVATAIEGLDSEAKVATGKYLTGIAIANGKISGFTEAELPKLSSATTGAGNVVTDIQVTDHEITFVKGMTVASDADLKAVSGIVDTFSAATVEKITSAFTYVDEKINGLDVAQISAEGQAITAISQTDGKISAVAGDIAAAHVIVADAGNKLAATTVEDALAELADKAKAITITNTDKSINVTSGDAGTVIDVNIKEGEKVLAKGGNGGLYTDIKLCGITPTSTTVKEEYVLYATDGTVLGDHIKIYKDSHIKSIEYITTPGDAHYQNLKYTYIDADGKEQTVYVDMSSLVLEAEFADGVKADDSGVVRGVVDSASEKFLTVGTDGFKLSGVQAAIDAAKASATTKVVEGTDEGNNMTIVPTTGTDGSVTYTVNLSDVASKTALTAEIAARKAVDGQTGQTYVANTGVSYIADATSLNDADVKLDAALKTVSDKVDTAIAGLDSSSSTTDSGHYITAITITDGKISAVGQSDKVNSASTAAHADAAKQVDSALTFSDVAGTNFEYNGSNAKSITFGKKVDGVGNSMSMDANGVVDVEIIDCGTY